MSDEEMQTKMGPVAEGIEARLRKRKAMEQEKANAQEALKEMLGDLPLRVGMDEHEQPLMMAVVQGMQELAMDVQDLKGATGLGWGRRIGLMSWRR